MQPGYIVQGKDFTHAFILITPDGFLHGSWSDTSQWSDIDYLLIFDPDQQFMTDVTDSFHHIQDPTSYATAIVTHFLDVSYVFEDFPELFI